MRLRDTDFNFIGLPVHRRLLISVPFLSTGGALAVFILTGISLQVGMIAAAVLVTGAVVLARTRLPEPSRRLVRSQALRGIAAGLLATAAYDLCRFTVVSLTDIAYWPFDVFSRFGRLLVGEAAPVGVAIAVGTGYHYLNGVGFAIAYMLLVRRPGILTGPARARGRGTCPGLARPGLCEPGTGMLIMAGDRESQLSGRGVVMIESVFEYLLSPVLSSRERDRGGGSDEQHDRRRDARPALPCAHPPAGGDLAVRAGLRALRPVDA